MIITEKDGKYYRMSKEMSKEEVLRSLNNYEYEKRTRTVHMREELIKILGVNRHLQRENALLRERIHRIAWQNMCSEKEIREAIQIDDDDLIKEIEKVSLENEELKKELYFLKH